jgi:hypothetical protein
MSFTKRHNKTANFGMRPESLIPKSAVATAPQRCELFVNYFTVLLTGSGSLRPGDSFAKILSRKWQDYHFVFFILQFSGFIFQFCDRIF